MRDERNQHVSAEAALFDGPLASMQPRITLYLAPNGRWFSDMSQAKDSAEIKRLFGTTQIPTPYTKEKHWEDVQFSIASLNPGTKIFVDILSRQDIRS